ncbi:cytochrome P450 [Mycena floridula]|nr:cytochrome P450 [Mycena floridula]
MSPALTLSLPLCLSAGAVIWLVSKVIRSFVDRGNGTALQGPPRMSWMHGYQPQLMGNDVAAAELYQTWAAEYGPIFVIPWTLGTTRTIVADPRAVAHFYARETYGYVQNKVTRITMANLFGKGILWAEGDMHRRQRKALTPAFSAASIRKLTPVFYDASYKLKHAWDALIDASSDNKAIIEVQQWMSNVALDSVGIGGFSHDFGALDGKESLIATSLASFGKKITTRPPIIYKLTGLLAPVMPYLMNLPIGPMKRVGELKVSLSLVGQDLLQRMRREKGLDSSNYDGENSVIGVLIKSESADTTVAMTQTEIRAQVNTMIIAGYITTSISLTWALINLCKYQDKQEKLRKELAMFGATDPTYDQLMSGSELPYLDAIVHEVLRLHPPLAMTLRDAAENDILPLAGPITTRTGQVISQVAIAKGSVIGVPIRAINTFETFWGPDAKEFRPERWLNEKGSESLRFKEIQGHRHLLTFTSGARECIGKQFALAEFKAVLVVLIRHYQFELPNGPETEIGQCRGILWKPKVEGEEGSDVPLLVRRIE